MSLGDWFRRLFSPSSSPSAGSAEDDAIVREEYGEAAAGPTEAGPVTGGVSGFAGLEDAEAVEGMEEQTEAPSDPAP